MWCLRRNIEEKYFLKRSGWKFEIYCGSCVNGRGVEVLEGEICPDHIHMLVSIPPKMSVAGFMGYLKGKSSLMIYKRWGSMKFAYWNREFWCRGYYVNPVTYLYGHYKFRFVYWLQVLFVIEEMSSLLLIIR